MTPDAQGMERKSSFFLPFLLLGRKRRDALTLLYRYCRIADDVSDEPGTPKQKHRRFNAFRLELEACLRGRPTPGFWRELRDAIDEHHIPPQALRDTLRGVEMDLRKVRLQTYTELLEYAHLVAGGPGRASMAIFGGRGPRHERTRRTSGPSCRSPTS